MPIYTKTGDKGTTAIFGGDRVAKSHPQVKAYGTIDELTSFIGLVAAKIDTKEDREFLIKMQKDLYQMMALLAGAKVTISEEEKEIQNFEKKIDEFDKQLPKLTRFILPGGTEMAGWFHILRTTTRRSERETVEFFLDTEASKSIPEDSQRIMLKYLNRLSDLFFMYARKYSEGKEILT
jgi:cob(I)alamin adenosyltransferase